MILWCGPFFVFIVYGSKNSLPSNKYMNAGRSSPASTSHILTIVYIHISLLHQVILSKCFQIASNIPALLWRMVGELVARENKVLSFRISELYTQSPARFAYNYVKIPFHWQPNMRLGFCASPHPFVYEVPLLVGCGAFSHIRAVNSNRHNAGEFLPRVANPQRLLPGCIQENISSAVWSGDLHPSIMWWALWHSDHFPGGCTPACMVGETNEVNGGKLAKKNVFSRCGSSLNWR